MLPLRSYEAYPVWLSTVRIDLRGLIACATQSRNEGLKHRPTSKPEDRFSAIAASLVPLRRSLYNSAVQSSCIHPPCPVRDPDPDQQCPCLALGRR